MPPMIAGHRCTALFLAAGIAPRGGRMRVGHVGRRHAGSHACPRHPRGSAPLHQPCGSLSPTKRPGDLSVIDAATQTVIATAPLGKRPRGIKASPDGKTLYVALSGSPQRRARRRSEDAAAARSQRRRHRRGRRRPPTKSAGSSTPAPIPSSWTSARTARGSTSPTKTPAQVSVVDLATGARRRPRSKIGEEPEGVTIRPDGKVVYVTSEGDGAVFAIDTATNKVLKRIPVGIAAALDRISARRIARLRLARKRRRARAGRRAAAQVPQAACTLEGQGNTPKPRPMGIAVDPDGSTVYVTSRIVRQPASSSIRRPTPATCRCRSVSARGAWRCAPDGKTIFTANGPSNDVVGGRSRDQAGGEEDCRRSAAVGMTRRWSLLLVVGRSSRWSLVVRMRS